MPVIKRYPNRKLYDTEAKQYITLDRIAEMIRQGDEIHVVDHASGEDLTAVTLTQIIFEQEKKQGGFLPRAVLADLIQAGGNSLNALQRTLRTPVNFWHQFDEEIKHRIQTLTERGELSEGEGRSLLDKLLAPSLRRHGEVDVRQVNSEAIEAYLAEHEIPTKRDLQELLDQIDSLTEKLDEINHLPRP